MNRLPFGESVVRERSAGRDRNGDPIGPPTSETFDGWGLDWNATYSNATFQNVNTTDIDGYCPRGQDIRAGDRILVTRGEDVLKFLVQGRPMWDQIHPMTGQDFGYKLVRLREVTSA